MKRKPKIADDLPSAIRIRLFADQLNDVERIRIASGNRLLSLTHDEVVGEKGGWFGKALPPDAAVVVSMTSIHDELKKLEGKITKELERAMRKDSLWEWGKKMKGIGLKTLARFLAAAGPLEARKHPSQLWSYCGFRPDQKRTKGVKSDWNPQAKVRAYLMAESCMKNRRSPYRVFYEGRRVHTAITHPDWPKGHSHADALRIVAKAILLDMWLAATKTKRKSAEEVKRSYEAGLTDSTRVSPNTMSLTESASPMIIAKELP